MKPIKEKTAKEMFEELGYEQKKEKHKIIYNSSGLYCSLSITFYLLVKDYRWEIACAENNDIFGIEIDMKVHNAINKQVEELKW